MAVVLGYGNRRYVVGGVVVGVALIILLRIFYIQVIDTSYKLSADSNVMRRVRVYPARGIVYDRRGEILVYNQAAYDLMVIPGQVKAMDTAAFCALLGITQEDFRSNLTAARQYSRLKPSLFVKQLSAESYGAIQEQLYQYPGFYTVPRTLRYYPRPVAAHLLGYVGEVSEAMLAGQSYYESGDYIGISGLERSQETTLRGVKGVNTFLVDVHNRVISAYAQGAYDTLAIAGGDLRLALDAELQEFGEYLMQGRKGSIVALDPSNGEILAMVSCPSYDPNLLVGRARSGNFRMLDTSSDNPLFNRALMAMYPPGSTFKLINGLIGLQEGVVNPSTHVHCGGLYPYGRGVACHNHPDAQSMAQAVKMSCNPYFCHVFRRVIDNPKYPNIEAAFEAWRGYVGRFGLGCRLNVDLPGELPGIVPTVDFYNRYFRKGGWNSLTIISLSIGQGELSLTPLQLANLAAIMANRGYYFTPHVVRAQAGIPTHDTAVHRTGIDRVHFEPIVEGMSASVNSPLGAGGTSWRAHSSRMEVCGKTGTSQNPHGEDHSVFIAFAPRENPRIALAVFIENAGFGGTWAAPIGGLIAEKFLCDSIYNVGMLQYIEQEIGHLLGAEPQRPPWVKVVQPVVSARPTGAVLQRDTMHSLPMQPIQPLAPAVLGDSAQSSMTPGGPGWRME